ncbi:hypothetical protein Poli38472_013415 [Pythium oligandrum]|uniref:Uncharacterized protein n=1 Tax=Pythium oligandrum TaxID=41045 RepID=A0A8K1C7Q7_PYTOL|nr:hypothetical protein Poli38472_013415 [Pythium oligandrum]|eukprot:TMW57941.1 hypothetical protein Poli38472_013415 [Pythium oligandrum]
MRRAVRLMLIGATVATNMAMVAAHGAQVHTGEASSLGNAAIARKMPCPLPMPKLNKGPSPVVSSNPPSVKKTPCPLPMPKLSKSLTDEGAGINVPGTIIMDPPPAMGGSEFAPGKVSAAEVDIAATATMDANGAVFLTGVGAPDSTDMTSTGPDLTTPSKPSKKPCPLPMPKVSKPVTEATTGLNAPGSIMMDPPLVDKASEDSISSAVDAPAMMEDEPSGGVFLGGVGAPDSADSDPMPSAPVAKKKPCPLPMPKVAKPAAGPDAGLNAAGTVMMDPAPAVDGSPDSFQESSTTTGGGDLAEGTFLSGVAAPTSDDTSPTPAPSAPTTKPSKKPCPLPMPKISSVSSKPSSTPIAGATTPTAGMDDLNLAMDGAGADLATLDTDSTLSPSLSPTSTDSSTEETEANTSGLTGAAMTSSEAMMSTLGDTSDVIDADEGSSATTTGVSDASMTTLTSPSSDSALELDDNSDLMGATEGDSTTGVSSVSTTSGSTASVSTTATDGALGMESLGADSTSDLGSVPELSDATESSTMATGTAGGSIDLEGLSATTVSSASSSATVGEPLTGGEDISPSLAGTGLPGSDGTTSMTSTSLSASTGESMGVPSTGTDAMMGLESMSDLGDATGGASLTTTAASDASNATTSSIDMAGTTLSSTLSGGLSDLSVDTTSTATLENLPGLGDALGGDLTSTTATSGDAALDMDSPATTTSATGPSASGSATTMMPGGMRAAELSSGGEALLDDMSTAGTEGTSTSSLDTFADLGGADDTSALISGAGSTSATSTSTFTATSTPIDSTLSGGVAPMDGLSSLDNAMESLSATTSASGASGPSADSASSVSALSDDGVSTSAAPSPAAKKKPCPLPMPKVSSASVSPPSASTLADLATTPVSGLGFAGALPADSAGAAFVPGAVMPAAGGATQSAQNLAGTGADGFPTAEALSGALSVLQNFLSMVSGGAGANSVATPTTSLAPFPAVTPGLTSGLAPAPVANPTSLSGVAAPIDGNSLSFSTLSDTTMMASAPSTAKTSRTLRGVDA